MILVDAVPLWTYFTPSHSSSVSIVNFEYVITGSSKFAGNTSTKCLNGSVDLNR